MAKRFTCRHLKNGYSAMGKSRKRPIYSGIKHRSIAESIAKEKAAAAIQARIRKKKK